MRTALLVTALVGFAGLGVLDILGGDAKRGAAAILLCAANALLLAG